MTSRLSEILKNAILIEMRGKSFYENASHSIDNDTVKNFFKDLAEEEETHMNFLKIQFRNVMKNNKLDLNVMKNYKPENLIITNELKQEINSANYESAAISVAILLEKNAYNFYKNLADNSIDADEKAVYRWLSDWEKGHLDSFMKLEEHVREQVWFDNHFWPS